MKQHTLKKSYTFRGRGLHTGKPVEMRLLPAPENQGIVFRRTDLPSAPSVAATIDHVGRTHRSTTLAVDGVRILTPEHLLSALYGLGVDNATVCLDAPEVPALDGCARIYADTLLTDGLAEQPADRQEIVVRTPFHYEDPRSGSRINFEPFDGFEIDVTVDFRARAIGVQQARWDAASDYARDIAPCRTFCFLREVLPLRLAGLIRGGTLDNALVVSGRGFVGSPTLHFDNEPARHKLLDLLGDLSLAGRPIRGCITAYKPGHLANTQALRQFLSAHTL